MKTEQLILANEANGTRTPLRSSDLLADNLNSNGLGKFAAQHYYQIEDNTLDPTLENMQSKPTDTSFVGLVINTSITEQVFS